MSKRSQNQKQNNRPNKKQRGRGRGRGNSEIIDMTDGPDDPLPPIEGFADIDGAYGEGGGQVVRNSFSLSALYSRPIRVTSIRANRSNPGLANQHLTGIRLISEITKGTLTGARVKSTCVTHKPGSLNGGEYEADTETAGSICLVVQIALPVALFSPSPCIITMKGGTNAAHAPQTDYLLKVFQPIIRKMGVEFDLQLVTRGFYPKGCGMAILKTNPVKTINPIVMEDRGDINTIEIFAFCAGVIQDHVPNRMVNEAETYLKRGLENYNNNKVEIAFNKIAVKEPKEKAFGDGTAILITAYTSTGCILAGSSIGERGKKAEDVGMEAAEDLLNNIRSGGCIDEYLQDQLIIFMGLADGHSKIKVGPLSGHTKTSIHYTEFFTGAKFNVTPTESRQGEEETFWLECDGVGYKNRGE
eukprot:TRINITY_DN2368_c0_g1_i1.p1 TRINITY_DN2368_c0_g1~~TRINITY_DN2368_c0_g1_i1.p1  ORF type:complete len:415 (-),score=81.39 TRINITY_DN2368_c0_g1_i1:1233-2477(-)